MPIPTLKLSPIALAALLLATSAAHAQQVQDSTVVQPDAPAAGAAQTMQTVTINASADASAAGLPKAYAGGQVARGGRLGLLGNTDMMDSPFNTTNFTQQLIQDQQAHSVADVVQNDPSVRVARGFGNFQELYVIRGFAVNSDDMAWNGLYGLLPRQYVAAELLERVEVLHGANTFLNGAAPGGGGIGGSVNLLPKRAGNEPLTELTVGGETGGQGSVAADIGRRFGPNGDFGVRVNLARHDGDTEVDNEKHKLSVASVGLDYRGNGFRLSADLGYQNDQLTDPRPSVTVSAGIPIPAAPDNARNFGQTWSYSNERDTFGTVRGEVDLAKDVVAWAAFGSRSGDEANVLASPTVTAADGTGNTYRFDNQRHDTVRTGEIGVRGKLQTGPVSHALAATYSGYWLDSRNAYALGSYFNTLPVNIYQPFGSPEQSNDFFVGGKLSAPLTTHKSILSSYALADTMGFLNDTLLVTVGARNQTIKDFSYDYNTGAENAKYNESKITPMAGVVYKVAKNLSVYGNYVEALQQGPVASGTNIDNVGQTFAPYKSRQEEAGVKYDAGTLGLSAAVFTTAQPSAYIQNRIFGVFGEQRNSGLELSVFGTPVRGVRVLGGLTLLKTEQKHTADGLNDGKDAIGVPDTQLNIGGEWDVPGVRGLTLTSRVTYTSTQYADGANLQELPSWTRLDLGARYMTKIADRFVTFRARVDNATDKNYWASAGGYPGSGYLVLGNPRTFALSATVDF